MLINILEFNHSFYQSFIITLHDAEPAAVNLALAGTGYRNFLWLYMSYCLFELFLIQADGSEGYRYHKPIQHVHFIIYFFPDKIVKH